MKVAAWGVLDAGGVLQTTHDTENEAVWAVKLRRGNWGDSCAYTVKPLIVSPNINKILRQVGANRRFPRGAPMGKSNVHDSDRPVYFQEVRFVDGGYAPDGTYWGYTPGEKMFCAFTPDLETEIYVRGRSNYEALKGLRKEYPRIKLARNTKDGDGARQRRALALGVSDETMATLAGYMKAHPHPLTNMRKIAELMALPLKSIKAIDSGVLRYIESPNEATIFEWREKFYVGNPHTFAQRRTRLFNV